MKEIQFSSKIAKASFNVVATLASGKTTGLTEKESDALKAYDVDDYFKSEIVRAYQEDGVTSGADKAKIDGVLLYIEWNVI